ncbi:ABC transporter ATPase [Sphingobacterium thalpophilum]|uniref:ABC transporter ATPase n=1 Tax=Sphingobacterium thalpophilum TaxID=259 RepID=UPI003D99C7EB
MKRIWIYQADRVLSEEESRQISVELADFAAQWKVHGEPLSASAELRDSLFIILKVDEAVAVASGCSIDSSVRFLKGIEERYDVRLFDRMCFAYKSATGIAVLDRAGFEKALHNGEIDDDTLVFDNTITYDHQLENTWVIPFKASWHKRLFS